MNKEEFLRQLEMLLTEVSVEERADAMAYYRSYFEDAGEGNEASIIEELESPQKVAESIKRDLGMVVVTDNAYEGNQTGGAGQSAWSGANGQAAQGAWNEQNSQTTQNAWNGANSQNTGSSQSYGSYNTNANRDAEYYKNVNDTINNLQKEKENSNTVILVLGIIVAVLLSPAWLGILAGIFGTLFGIAVAIVAVTGALLVTGVVLTCVGIGCLFTGRLVIGLGLIGAGLIVLALGLLALIGAVWLFGGFLPWAVKGIVNLCKKPFKNRKERAAA